MRALFLAAAAALVPATAPASAATITIGSTLARSCYEAAVDRVATRQTMTHCNRALTEESLSAHDIVATHVNRGILRMVDGNFGGAEADYLRALSLDDKQADAWLNLGVLRYRQGNSEEALTMFDKALAYRTDEPALAHFGRALAYEDRGNIRAAYADLVRAKALKPNWEEPSLELQRYRVVAR